MNILVFKIQTDIELPLRPEDVSRFNSNPEFTSCKPGMHIIITDKQVYLKTTKDSFCVELKTDSKFIEINPAIFKPFEL